MEWHGRTNFRKESSRASTCSKYKLTSTRWRRLHVFLKKLASSSINVIEELLKLGSSVDARDFRGRGYFYFTCKQGQCDIKKCKISLLSIRLILPGLATQAIRHSMRPHVPVRCTLAMLDST